MARIIRKNKISSCELDALKKFSFIFNSDDNKYYIAIEKDDIYDKVSNK